MFFSCFPNVQKNNESLKPNEFEFEDMSGASMEKIVSFSYDGGIGPFANEDEMIEVQSFAKKYDVDDLDEFCTDQINRFITIENGLGILLKYPQSNIIQTACVNIIIENFTIVSQRPQFVNISPTLFEKILQSEELVAPEIDIFLAFLKWYHKIPIFSLAMDCLPFPSTINADVVIRQIRFPLLSADVRLFLLKIIVLSIVSQSNVNSFIFLSFQNRFSINMHFQF